MPKRVNRPMRAVFDGVVLAESHVTMWVDGNHYFPIGSVQTRYLTMSDTKGLCYWKGVAHYRGIATDGRKLPDAAWSYPKPTPLARRIRDHVAFGLSVVVEPVPTGQPADEDPPLYW